MNFRTAIFPALVWASTANAFAAVIGTNVPALPLTVERIAALPIAEQPAWRDYLSRSERQMRTDKDFLRAEMAAHGIKSATNAPPAHNAGKIRIDNRVAWYGSADARRIADDIVSFQTPAGGWSKNLDMTRGERTPGEAFTSDNNSKFANATDFDEAADTNWDYVGTLDNDATTTQLRFLAEVIAANQTNTAAWQKSFLHGLDYIFAAQYPNGGWPQVWPLQGGYHDAVTFNDDAMLNVLTLLRDTAAGTNEFAFMPADARAKAAASLQRGIDCVLAAQIVVNGQRTVWCQQHDALTLQPASARNYEMPCENSAESAGLVLFLMQLPNPDSSVVASVRAACAWFDKTKIEGKAYKPVQGRGRELITAPGSVVWARCYEIGTDRPIFGDRDKSIHDDVSEISKERRNGYGWYRDTPKRVLEHFKRWSKKHPQ